MAKGNSKIEQNGDVNIFIHSLHLPIKNTKRFQPRLISKTSSAPDTPRKKSIFASIISFIIKNLIW